MTMNISQKNAPVGNIALFPLLSPATVDRSAPDNLQEHLSVLRGFASTQRFSRNETIFQEGDRAATIYRVVVGTIRLCRHTPDGRRHIADFALTGDLFGVFGSPEHVFTAEAVTDVTLVAYPRTQLDRLSDRDPRFRANILSHLSSTLMTAQLHTFVLGCQSAKERLASFLIRHAERTGAMATGKLQLSMGRQDIADHLGLTIETICRAVTALKNEKTIAVPSIHQIELRNIEALCELSEGSALH